MIIKPSYEELEERLKLFEHTESQLKVLENKLREEIDWRKLLVNESRDGIVVVNQDCKVVEANKQFADMLGYSLTETLQLHVWDWDTQYSKEEIVAMASEVDETGHHFETQFRCKNASLVDVQLSNNGAYYNGQKLIFCICRNVTERNRARVKMENTVRELKEALAEVKILRDILPLCAYCKNIRDDKGYWERVDVYLSKHSNVNISHGICPQCSKEHFPDIDVESDV